MSDEKPLHVRVAEALGCTPGSVSFVGPDARLTIWTCPCAGYMHARPVSNAQGLSYKNPLERYDTDWSATGPLIERFQFDLFAYSPVKRWSARADLIEGEPTMHGETPLIAVCNLILALADLGRLEEPRE